MELTQQLACFERGIVLIDDVARLSGLRLGCERNTEVSAEEPSAKCKVMRRRKRAAKKSSASESLELFVCGDRKEDLCKPVLNVVVELKETNDEGERVE